MVNLPVFKVIIKPAWIIKVNSRQLVASSGTKFVAYEREPATSFSGREQVADLKIIIEQVNKHVVGQVYYVVYHSFSI